MPKAPKKITKPKKAEKKKNPLFQAKPRSFRVGGDIQPKRDLTRFVRWPRYITLQRQKRVLLQRLKVPPQIHQFTKTLDKNQSSNLFKLLASYAPEKPAEKKQRLVAQAEAKKDGKQVETKKPIVLKYGLNHITTLIENKQAKLVVIAHDVDPIELVIFLPQLCRKNDVPFAFVKGKAALGKLVNKKTATAVALTEVRNEDKAKLQQFSELFKTNYNANDELRKTWGGGILGQKSQHKVEALAKAVQEEQIKKAKL
ncbi:60S ribosomal L7Ae-like protein (macronuclear) [Tetrahymena thermophila SB210]|uniref:Large ribosomal subunit protein eL8 n=2 Tax=Tetrahymena thermophila TaxID=5911 RepID=RL7A_TETTH|nr:60S ribosomal L7Ae-like protein [Tetrahymena thermophila SB210]P0DJ14.1 RecName: Full=Large ribosomal subunit protein eL8; AltName: Full=60S ribosomal protein L7a [Tetrahymena thermophila]4V8P_BF Chain BF, RPL7A [Tetrahymena thermophila]4V8P_CF Chain CF, RPL7A [Tetrahymena thermophila]4V8P_EF Chain EF, RPL7A [Tetrahymena thermophila]4V8P_GF Chain GF, RPL7A [Tetrahymena thermophila]EAR83924.2 60S ribosomal L7Ae-like protein [Tetrahymena thermophila SB210]|eukprot:XP_001031587.2 60S ribosomal L7Ae-like protein [Tetrahymena thermophila SB210]